MDDVRNLLRESGRGMTLEELAHATGLAKGTVQRNVADLWKKHEISRMYKFNELNIRYVYYFYGSRMPNDNAMGCAWQGKDHLLKVLSAHR